MKRLPPVIVIIISFLATILLGSILLVLPISLNKGASISYIDSFFVSTSALCVTGLTPVNVAQTFNIFGKIIIALLIQVGGLGCITVSSFLFLMLGARFGIGDRYLLKEALSQDNASNVIRLLKNIVKITLLVELIGAILCTIAFTRYYDFFTALGVGVFHSISSFNNAGFDIIGGSSLIGFSSDIFLNITTMTLIVIGGLGFIVILDLFKNKFNIKKCSLHTKVVLTMTISLIVVGTLLVKVAMKDNVTFLESLFTSISARTAGFSTFNFATLNGGAVMIVALLMLIGASPASTGGGIKTTTVYTMIKSMISFARGKPTLANHKKISEESKMRAFTLFFVAISVIFASMMLILLFEENNANVNLSNVLFEVFSAFATVGLSMNLTPYLGVLSKIILCVLMFFGRIGLITIMGMWNSSWNKPNVSNMDYLEEKIIIG